MADKLAVKIGKGMFEKQMQQYEPPNPLYEEYVDKKGKTRRRKRELPPGLSKRDEKILRKVKKRAYYLDKGFNICGMRFGYTFLIGLIPVVGDVADFALGYALVVRKASQADLPVELTGHMMVNISIATGLGLVPFVGDIALAAYKANSRNAALLENYLAARGAEALKGSASKNDPKNLLPGAGLKQGEQVGDGTSAVADPLSARKSAKEGKKQAKMTV